MKRTIKFRGKRIDNGEWVYGDLITGQGAKYGNMYILPQTQFYPSGCNDLDGWNVIPDTVGQLRHINKYGEYYDGDIYYHAGYGNETVTDLCELQTALMYGNSDDINQIIGNIHDNTEML